MLNIMKADLYRIFKGKAVYVTFGVLFLYSILVVLSMAKSGLHYGRLNAIVAATQGVLGILCFILIMGVIIMGFDFSSGTIKNALSRGVPRTTLYFSKLILALGFAFVIYFLQIIISIIMYVIFDICIYATKAYSYYPTPSMDSIPLLQIVLVQLLIIVAAVCVGTFFAFAFKKLGFIIGVTMIFFIGISILVSIVAQAGHGMFYFIQYTDLIYTIASPLTPKPATGTLIAIFTACGYIVISITLGVVLFNRSDIKA